MGRSRKIADWEVAMALYRGETRADIARHIGLPYQTIVKAAARWIDAGGEPYPALAVTRPPAPRNKKIVDLYRSGQSMRAVGAAFDISMERVRQIIVSYEKKTGRSVERHPRRYRSSPPPTAPRVTWLCQGGCGTERRVTSRALEISPSMCRKCRGKQKIPPPEIIESWIAQRRQDVPFMRIALQAGYNHQQGHYPLRYIAMYLRDAGRLDELKELQRGRSLRWLSKKIPAVAEMLAAEQS